MNCALWRRFFIIFIKNLKMKLGSYVFFLYVAYNISDPHKPDSDFLETWILSNFEKTSKLKKNDLLIYQFYVKLNFKNFFTNTFFWFFASFRGYWKVDLTVFRNAKKREFSTWNISVKNTVRQLNFFLKCSKWLVLSITSVIFVKTT